MNYFIFYGKSCVAYTDNKDIMKAFIDKFKHKDKFTFDKFKKINRFYLEDQMIEDLTLYYHNDNDMFLNDFLVSELYEYSYQLTEDLVNLANTLDKATEYIRIADNEKYIVFQSLLNFGVVIEDVEWELFNSLDIIQALEDNVFLSLDEQFNRKD